MRVGLRRLRELIDGFGAPGSRGWGGGVTYSIVARDPGTGEMGAATQSQELGRWAPQFLEAARRFGKAGLMPTDVIERILLVT